MAHVHRTRKLAQRAGKRGRHRAQPARRQPYAWLGLGAVTFGVGAALASGSGIAHADASGSADSSSAHSTGTSRDAGTNAGHKSSSRTAADESDGRSLRGADPGANPDSAEAGTKGSTAPTRSDRAASRSVETADVDFDDRDEPDDSSTDADADADSAPTSESLPSRAQSTENRQSSNTSAALPDDETPKAATAIPSLDESGEKADAAPIVDPAVNSVPDGGNATATATAERASAGPLDQIAVLLGNQSPTIGLAHTGQGRDGVVSGTLTVDDPDSATLTFSVTGDPTHGAVILDADGSYTYTPDTPSPSAAISDSFEVTVSDADSGFHIHGVSGLINLLTLGIIGDSGHTSSATAQVTVAAATPQPTIITKVNLGLTGTDAPRSVTISPDGRLVFVGNGNWSSTWGGFDPTRGSLSVIDTTSNTVTATIDTDWTPIASSVSPSGLLYTVGMIGGINTADYVLSVMNPVDYLTKSAFNEPRTIEGLYMQPIATAVAPNGDSVVIGGRNGQVAVVDPMTAAVTHTADLGFGNHAEKIFITPDSKTAWISGGYFQPLFKMDLSTGSVGSVSVPYSHGATMSSDGTKLYVLSDGYNNTQRVQVVDAATGDVTSFDPFTEGIYTNVVDLAVSPDGRFLYLRDANSGNSYTTNSIDVVDTTTGVIVASLDVPAPDILSGLQDMVISPEGNRIYLATGNDVAVVKVNATDKPELPAMVQSSTAADLLMNIPRQTDTIYAEKVQDDQGRTRMIVYMSGIEAGVNESTLASIFSNGGLLHPDVEAYIDGAYVAWGGAEAIDEIQLVGHSNGGQQMQAYAESGTYGDEVASVVVFAAPLTKTEDDFDSDAVAFVSRNDPVPTGFTHWVNPGVAWDSDSKQIYWFASEEPVGGLYLVDMKYHHAASYYRIASQFDDPTFDPIGGNYSDRRATIARFGGTPIDFMPTYHVSVLWQITV
ncbi:hypothetical protein BH10ACT9_BH10ACT9_27230 [soil metagenome]